MNKLSGDKVLNVTKSSAGFGYTSIRFPVAVSCSGISNGRGQQLLKSELAWHINRYIIEEETVILYLGKEHDLEALRDRLAVQLSPTIIDSVEENDLWLELERAHMAMSEELINLGKDAFTGQDLVVIALSHLQ